LILACFIWYNNRIGGVTQFVNNDPARYFSFQNYLGETVNKGIEGF
jgi:Fe(3+) dicitrate transport protein